MALAKYFDTGFKMLFVMLLSLFSERAFSWDKSYCSDTQNAQNSVGFLLNLNKMNSLSEAYFKEKNGDEYLDSDDLQMSEAEVKALYSKEQFKAWKILKDLSSGKKPNTQAACAYIDISAESAVKNHHFINPEKWNINQAEFLAVYSYTSNDFAVINPALRKKTDDLKYIDQILRNLDSALRKLPIYKGVVLRGVELNAKVAKDLKVGAVFQDLAYLSTSISSPYGGTYQFIIKSETGREVFHLSPNPDEREVLFLRNTEFKITAIYQKASQTYVEMIEKSPSAVTINGKTSESLQSLY